MWSHVGVGVVRHGCGGNGACSVILVGWSRWAWFWWGGGTYGERKY